MLICRHSLFRLSSITSAFLLSNSKPFFMLSIGGKIWAHISLLLSFLIRNPLVPPLLNSFTVRCVFLLTAFMLQLPFLCVLFDKFFALFLNKQEMQHDRCGYAHNYPHLVITIIMLLSKKKKVTRRCGSVRRMMVLVTDFPLYLTSLPSTLTIVGHSFSCKTCLLLLLPFLSSSDSSFLYGLILVFPSHFFHYFSCLTLSTLGGLVFVSLSQGCVEANQQNLSLTVFNQQNLSLIV